MNKKYRLSIGHTSDISYISLPLCLSSLSLSRSVSPLSLSLCLSPSRSVSASIFHSVVDLAQRLSFNTVCEVTRYRGFDPSLTMNKIHLSVSLPPPLSLLSVSLSSALSFSFPFCLSSLSLYLPWLSQSPLLFLIFSLPSSILLLPSLSFTHSFSVIVFG